MLQLLVTANAVTSLLILYTMMIEVIPSSETSVLMIAARHIPQDDILHSHRRENLKSYIALTGWALWQTCNMSPVRYKQGFYIPEDGIVHSHLCKTLKS
jgi:hypothetical protein